MAFSGETIWLDEIKFNGTKYKKGVKFNGEKYYKMKFNDKVFEFKTVKLQQGYSGVRTNKFDSSKEADIVWREIRGGSSQNRSIYTWGVEELIPCIVRDGNVYELEWGDKTLKKDNNWVTDKSGNLFMKWSGSQIYWQNNSGNTYSLGVIIKERDK